jgi:hypothetical protein
MALERGVAVLAIDSHTGSNQWLDVKKRADNYMALSVVVSFGAINSILGGRWTLAMELNF